MAERLLLLLRHANAERTRPGERDHDRVLSERGRREARNVGELIAERGFRPDRALVSTARRTRETFDILAQSLAEPIDRREIEALFAPAAGYLPIIRAEGGEARCLLVVGHNPAIQELAVALSADRSDREASAVADHMPAAGLVVLGFDGDWDGLAERTMRLVAFLAPDQTG